MKHDIRILKESFINFLTETMKNKTTLSERVQKLKMQKHAGVITESQYEKRLKLAEEEAAAAPATGGGLIDINAGPAAVLAAAAKIPQNVLKAGATDGKPDDEKITITEGFCLAEKFIPSQQNIDCDKSLGDQIYDLYGNLDVAIKGGRMQSQEGSFPILTFGGKFIIDGHHRWSQALITNPKCNLEIADIAAPGVTDIKQAIALTHVILFALYGKSPVKSAPGTNLVGLAPETMKEMVMTGKGLKVNKPIVQSSIDKLFAAGLIKEKTAEAAANMFAGNVPLVKEGPFPRIEMPQPLDAKDPTGLTTAPAELPAGSINYINPKQVDVKESVHKSITKMLNEAVKH